MSTFAEQLSAFRKEKGLTQEQLAQQANVSRTTISRWESGKGLPDIETVKQLSQVLNCNFFAQDEPAKEEPATEEEPAAEETEEQQPPQGRRPGKVWLLAIGMLCLAALCVVLLLRGADQPSDEPEKVQPSAAQTAYAPSARADIVITPSKTVAYLEPFHPESGQNAYGWDVNFTFENRSDVPFTPEKIVGYFYKGDELYSTLTVPYEDFRPRMANDKLLNSNDPLDWSFGTDQLYFTHLTVAIYGVDDHENEIEASVTVQYSQKYADHEKNTVLLKIFPVNSAVTPVVDEAFGSADPRFIYAFSIQNISNQYTYTITEAKLQLEYADGAAPFTMEFDGENIKQMLGNNVFSPGDGNRWMGSEPVYSGFSGVTLTMRGVDQQGAVFTTSGYVNFIYAE